MPYIKLRGFTHYGAHLTYIANLQNTKSELSLFASVEPKMSLKPFFEYLKFSKKKKKKNYVNVYA